MTWWERFKRDAELERPVDYLIMLGGCALGVAMLYASVVAILVIGSLAQ